MKHTVYLNECATCGMTKARISRLRRNNPGDIVEVVDTRIDRKQREKHLIYLKHAGMDTGSIQSIVVSDKVIKLLREV